MGGRRASSSTSSGRYTTFSILLCRRHAKPSTATKIFRLCVAHNPSIRRFIGSIFLNNIRLAISVYTGRGNMLAKSDVPKTTKVMSSVSISDDDAFEMMSNFLESEKIKQKSLDLTGEEYLASSSHAWSELRLACNSLLKDKDDPRAVAPWKKAESSSSGNLNEISLEEPSSPGVNEGKAMTPSEKKSAKKAKKEAKKAKKEAKKAKKEQKKRKRESTS